MGDEPHPESCHVQTLALAMGTNPVLAQASLCPALAEQPEILSSKGPGSPGTLRSQAKTPLAPASEHFLALVPLVSVR